MKSISLLVIVVGTSHAFSATGPPRTTRLSPSVSGAGSSRTALRLAKARRGLLTSDMDGEGGASKSKSKSQYGKRMRSGGTKSKRGRKSGGVGKGDGEDDGATISPLLAEWAKEDDSDDDSNDGERATSSKATSGGGVNTATSAASDVFVPFASEDEGDEGGESNSKGKGRRKSSKGSSKGSSERTKRRSARAALSAATSLRMNAILEDIEDTLGTNDFDVPGLVSSIASLADLNSASTERTLLPGLKSILSARPPTRGAEAEKEQPTYRLAWVGSDDAICHVGTSLHKVPLARLLEMFVILGRNRWELLEVIRVLGPFPNIRNTLKGEPKVTRLEVSGENGREGARLEVSYFSMIDGTGKEILAGKADNVKVVGLDVWFANERAIVCTIPRTGDEGDGGEGWGVDPLSGNGSNILLFMAEENLDEELEKLRAA